MLRSLQGFAFCMRTLGRMRRYQSEATCVKNPAFENLSLEGVTMVRNKETARKVIDILYKNRGRIHAWDTETIGIEVKDESPVGKGLVICASSFCGPEIDFGNGPRLFIDNYADAEGVIDEFKGYFEDPTIMKCWHNYGFDRHILYNHGIDVQGFGGDTMHMARLYDPSRVPHDYSLSKMSEIYEKEINAIKQKIFTYIKTQYKNEKSKQDCLENFIRSTSKRTKVNIKNTFGYYKTLKTGQQGKILTIPPIEEMHTSKDLIHKWVEYSVFDAEITYFLRELLAYELIKYPVSTAGNRNLYDLYCMYWRPFGELLTDMERKGIKINLEHLQKIQTEAENDRDSHKNKFIEWVNSVQDNAIEFNPSSSQQMQQLLFAPFYRVKIVKKAKRKEESEATANEEDSTEEVPEKKTNIHTTQDYYSPTRLFRVENLSGERKYENKPPLKYRNMLITGLGIPPVDYN